MGELRRAGRGVWHWISLLAGAGMGACGPRKRARCWLEGADRKAGVHSVSRRTLWVQEFATCMPGVGKLHLRQQHPALRLWKAAHASVLDACCTGRQHNST